MLDYPLLLTTGLTAAMVVVMWTADYLLIQIQQQAKLISREAE